MSETPSTNDPKIIDKQKKFNPKALTLAVAAVVVIAGSYFIYERFLMTKIAKIIALLISATPKTPS